MPTFYVDDAGDNTDGSTWAKAYTSLSALDDAVAIASAVDVSASITAYVTVSVTPSVFYESGLNALIPGAGVVYASTNLMIPAAGILQV